MKRLSDSLPLWRFYGVVVIFLAGLTMIGGCSQTCEEPVMLTGAARPAKNAAEKIRFETLSNDNAKLAWQDLFSYYKSGDPDDLKSAAMFFNYCWQWNPGNYNAYWGWGIIRGIQAESANDSATVDVRLNQSIAFLLQAKEHVPADEIDNLDLDLANAQTGIGSFYLTQNRPQPATEALARAQSLLQAVLVRQPANGRAYYLLAANCFYRRDLDGAKLNAQNAARNNFKVPESFLKEMK